ncbi:release factor glutamine methyltransferase [Gelidibacter algens]|jgi:release factor glutamine methyltransferase|uniref:Release factor glutamine methyltransferase n=1 Tax=Gelidibacter algens TaxID=49280 RepID=A0A1A7R675_9FLAO|nr:peptide chain release factor N(5)-glutamine methyltransferase [Gelidibacter algens]OBX26252.1 protein-(glutamine-N5) methyltransferase, release factor-specific [Gelidibacter algens]RAJ24867.1 release factor glutamine methyltransferase [Gelidibacter algens]
MLLKTLRDQFYTELTEHYPETEIQSFFNLLSECFLKMKGHEVSLNLYAPISGKKTEKFENAIKRLKKHEPIQYIIGTTEFYGLPFKVTESTLIPRPETEELVQWVTDVSTSKTENFSILDIGTGSGCIAISLAKSSPNATVYAIDVSKKALIIAKTNAKLNKVDVEFVELDILNWQNEPWNMEFEDVKFDIIVSNPPYVRQLEKAQMSANVLRHEPGLALYVEDDEPLVFYKTIAEFATAHLKDQGQLFFEINQYLGTEMIEFLEGSNFKDVVLKKDIFGNDRMVSGIKMS